jgi:hypothetical protein
MAKMAKMAKYRSAIWSLELNVLVSVLCICWCTSSHTVSSPGSSLLKAYAPMPREHP